MMTERTKMRYVTCPTCGKQLFKISGVCNVEVTCPRCKSEVVGIIDEIYVKLFEDRRGNNGRKNGGSKYSTDMEQLRKSRAAV